MIKFVSGGIYSLGTPVSSTNKTDRHDITEILLDVANNTITLTLLTNGSTYMNNKKYMTYYVVKLYINIWVLIENIFQCMQVF